MSQVEACRRSLKGLPNLYGELTDLTKRVTTHQEQLLKGELYFQKGTLKAQQDRNQYLTRQLQEYQD